MARKAKDIIPTLIPAKKIEAPGLDELVRDGNENKLNIDAPIIKKEKIPLWADRWPAEALKEKRLAMGAREFDRGYRQRAISDEDLVFKPEWIDAALDRNLVMPDHVERGSFWTKFYRDAGVDLAIASADKEADFFCIIGAATTRDWHRWVMCMGFTRGLSFGRQAAVLLEFQDRFAFDIMTVETNGYQEALVKHFKEEGAGGKIPIRGFHTGAVQKRDIELGVPSIGVEFEQGRWHIPYGDARTRRAFDPLIEELKMYPTPGAHDDAIMALFFARESRRIGSFGIPRVSVVGL